MLTVPMLALLSDPAEDPTTAPLGLMTEMLRTRPEEAVEVEVAPATFPLVWECCWRSAEAEGEAEEGEKECRLRLSSTDRL